MRRQTDKIRFTSMLTVCAVMSALTGCAKGIYPDLPNDAIAFEADTLTDPGDDNAGYLSITYEGRTYIAYGTLGSGKRLRGKDIAQCVGYIVPDEHSSSATNPGDTGRRIYTLSDDPAHHYLLERDNIGFMNNPSFWRAVDTQEEKIFTPAYIERLEYAFWD